MSEALTRIDAAVTPRARALALTTAAAGWVFVLYVAFQPGLLSADPLDQLGQGLTGQFTNQHPPLLSALLALAFRATGSVWPVLLVQLVVIAGAVLLLVRRAGWTWGACAAGALFLALPPVWSISIAVWKDVALVCAMLLAIAALAYRQGALALVLLFVAASCRLNAVLAAAPLLVPLSLRWAWLERPRWRRWAFCAVALALAVAIPKRIERALGAQDAWALAWVLADDLAGLYARHPDDFSRSLFADETSPAELRQLYRAESCLGVFFGDGSAARPIGLGPLPAQRAALRAEWLQRVREHPVSYLRLRAVRFARLLGFRREVFYPFHWQIDPNHHGLALKRPHTLAHRALVSLRDASANGLFFRHWLWLGLLGAVAVLAFRRGAQLSAWVAVSGLAYAAGYLLVAPAADFRYGFWCIAALFSALALLGLRERQTTAIPRQSRALEAAKEPQL